MTGQTLSALTFARQFEQFRQLVLEESGEEFQSFQDGLPWKWESYKSDVRNEGRRRLQFPKWTTADAGSGRILKRVIQAIEIKAAPGKEKNNLVYWEGKKGPKSRSHGKLLDAMTDQAARKPLERLLRDFYQQRIDPQPAFEGLISLVGKRYDLMAYLFFLYDSSRFTPIAPATFDQAFSLLGIDLTTSGRCSWENYMAYNSALQSVRRALRDIAQIDSPRLLDAHSFCWILARLKAVATPVDVVIPLPLPLQAEEAPPQTGSGGPKPDEFAVVTSEDFALLDAEKRRLGKLAQDIAKQSECRRLKAAGHSDPEAAVVPVWDEPGRGYDILSQELNGTPRHIEVKAAQRGGGRLAFIVTDHEWRMSQSLPNYHFYLVINPDSRKPVVRMVSASDLRAQWLKPLSYRIAIASDPAR